MVNPNRFYTYAYLRVDRTPYYIGKGSGKRIYNTNGRPCGKPRDKSRIILLKQNLTEEEAFKHEIYMIAVFGRKGLGTGILHNKTDGGEGTSGAIVSEETRRKQSEKRKGKNNPNYGKTHSKETRRKQSEAKMGKCSSKETRKKQSEALKGKNSPHYGKTGENSSSYGRKWWNDGCENNKFCLECPGDGWVLGRGKSHKNKKIWNDGLGNRKYSKECPGGGWVLGAGIPFTCMHHYEITSPSGEVFITNNLSDFCRKNSQYELDRRSMCDVVNGRNKHHKGWTVLILAQGT